MITGRRSAAVPPHDVDGTVQQKKPGHVLRSPARLETRCPKPVRAADSGRQSHLAQLRGPRRPLVSSFTWAWLFTGEPPPLARDPRSTEPPAVAFAALHTAPAD